MATKPTKPTTEDGENGGLTEEDIKNLETDKTPYWEKDDEKSSTTAK